MGRLSSALGAVPSHPDTKALNCRPFPVNSFYTATLAVLPGAEKQMVVSVACPQNRGSDTWPRPLT